MRRDIVWGDKSYSLESAIKGQITIGRSGLRAQLTFLSQINMMEIVHKDRCAKEQCHPVVQYCTSCNCKGAYYQRLGYTGYWLHWLPFSLQWTNPTPESNTRGCSDKQRSETFHHQHQGTATTLQHFHAERELAPFTVYNSSLENINVIQLIPSFV